jgi:hypothetical protein
MAKGPTKRVRLNRGALDKVTLAVSDGLFELAKQVVTEAGATAPDSPLDPFPTGEGLPKQGGVLGFVNGQKVNGWSLRGTQPAKPRSMRATVKSGVTVVAGFGHPARFVERGTIRTPAQPFFQPTADRLITPENARAVLEPLVASKLGRR